MTAFPERTVTIPTGLFQNGERYNDVTLRPLIGTDELLLLEASGVGRSAIVSQLLTACIDAIGSVAPVTTATVDALSVGDREALMLQLRRMTYGDGLSAVVPCPACGETLDLDLRVSDLLLPATSAATQDSMVTLESQDGTWRAWLRRVNGADQRAAQGVADPVGTLLSRCVVELRRPDGALVPVEKLAAELVAELDRALADLDPQADIRLNLECPACHEKFAAPFDAAGHFFTELAAEADLLLRDVAAIARALHWREADILALPRPRRRAYAALAVGR